jgi:acetamidase/formamidase
LLGPVDVRDARAGGGLDVEILDIQHHRWAWTGLIPGFGLLHERFAEPHLLHWELIDDRCCFGHRDIVVPFEPFCGCIGVAPAEPGRMNTIPPRANGGNLDLRDAGVGATVRLPVFRDGAGLSIGDGHAAQGDGELAGTGVEAPLTITTRITARPQNPTAAITMNTTPSPRPRPDLHARGRFTVAIADDDPRAAARRAAMALLEHVADALALPEPLAMMLCSAVADLRIAQAVNEPNWTVAASFPRALLPDP